MRIFNKFIESKKEPSNKNDIWFDGSVFRIYKEEEWQAFTLPNDAAEKVAEVIKKVNELDKGEAYIIGDTLTFRNYADASIEGETLKL